MLLAGLMPALMLNELLIRPLLNPLRRSTEAITSGLLEHTPAGSRRTEVEAWVKRQGWRDGGRPYALGSKFPLQRLVGEYREFGFTVYVFAEWWFGADDRLEAVEVHKWVADAL